MIGTTDLPKILITGYRGFIGSHLTRELDYIGIDLKDGGDLLTCDLPDADVVIHLAAQADVMSSVRDPLRDAIQNILITIRLLKRYQNSKIIFASSGGAIQETVESPYGLSKLTCENYIKMLHKNAVILRFPNIFGPGEHGVVGKFLEGNIRIYGDGSAIRDYVYVGDLVKAIKSSIEWEPGTYSLGSEKPYTVLQLAEATGKEIGFLPAREGELHTSIVPNTAPWRPIVDVLDYIRSNSGNS
jgi:nucleoside-diphosphate-sugar epimerase